MLKAKCPCCKKKTLSFYNFAEQLISTSILWDGYQCPNCNRDLLSLHVRIGSYIFHITFFLVVNAVLDIFIFPKHESIANQILYSFSFFIIYAFIIIFITFLFATTKCRNFRSE